MKKRQNESKDLFALAIVGLFLMNLSILGGSPRNSSVGNFPSNIMPTSAALVSPACSDAPTYTDAPDVLPPGAYQEGVAVGDFNNDGNQDILFSSGTTHNVSLRLGDGNGGFSGNDNFNTPDNPWRIVTADFNGDENLDFAVAASQYAHVRLGDGNGGFDSGTNYQMTGQNNWITSADFNGDGIPDLASTLSVYYTNDHVAIRYGDGSGGFGPLITLSAGQILSTIIAGDFNGDSKVDFAVSSFVGNAVAIRLGDGAGGFTAAPDVPVGSGAREIGIGDFNSDGFQDLAVTNELSGTISIRLGDGLGGFSPLTELAAANHPYALVVTDLNNDGNDDILQSNYGGGPIGAYLGDGNGGFTLLPYILSDNGTNVIAVGDFNNDGIKDFATGNDSSFPRIRIRLGNCTLADDVASSTSIQPSVSPNAAGWFKTDVNFALTAEDNAGGAGVQSVTYSASGAQTIPPTTVSGSNANITISAEGETTFSYYAEDNAGNVETTNNLTVRIDKTSPTISVTSPTGGSYLLNQAVTVGFNCTDDVSGTDSCDGTTADGGALDSGSIGSKTFTVSATDIAGNTSSSTVNYTVGYGINVLFDQTKAHKSGSTVPIKIRLVDANGVNLSSSATVVHAVSVYQTSSQASTTLDDAGNANPDFDFRYDTGLGGYIFNLKTTGYGTGSYLLNFVVGNSPTVYSVEFQVRQ